MFGFGCCGVGKFGICEKQKLQKKTERNRKVVLKRSLLIMPTLEGAGKLALPAFSLECALGKMQDVPMRVGKKSGWKKRINFALGM